MMKFARVFLIFCYGLFTITAQTLLFREFLTTFEGSEFSIGLFFTSWFFWIALGAILAWRPFKLIQAVQNHIELLFLAYIPAFILEFVLIIQARQIAGISAYTLWPLGPMTLMAFLVNAPISIITGMFFPLACRWIQQDSRLPVSGVYKVEAAGAFVGGIAATILLGLGVSAMTIFFLLAIIVSLAVWIVQLSRKRLYASVLAAILPVGIFICLWFGVDKTVNQHIQSMKWAKLLPAQALTGSFQTAQAEYLYGTYEGQWLVVREGSACEVLPNKESTGRIAAMVLSQKPDAKKILIIGSGLGLCHDFLLLPQIERVTWTHCDTQYVQQVSSYLPERFKINDTRMEYLTEDIRTELFNKTNTYDIVIINLPDAASSILNRYFTEEFYQRLKGAMSAGGIAAVRITGGENIMGTELIDLGASTQKTLKQVFSNFVLVPGDDTWFIVSESDRLNGSPRGLERRISRIQNIDAVFKPSAISAVYQPDRAANAIEAYDSIDLPRELLISKDSRPLASLYSLLLAWKQSGSPMTKIVKLLALAGAAVFLIPIAVYIVLRIFYITGAKRQDAVSGFDSAFLVFSAGWVGIGIEIVLMYMYQTRFGSLYLHIGVISSMFMLGLTVGACVTQYVLSKGFGKWLFFAVIMIHILLLLGVVYLAIDFWSYLYFAATFFLCGFCTGSYFPIAAKQLADSSLETGLSGGKLETADHIGAAAGSLVTGLALVPILGTKGAVWFFIALIAANIPAALWKIFGKQPSLAVSFLDFRRAGYVLFGIAASAILSSNFLAYTAAKQTPSLHADTVRLLAGQLSVEYTQSVLPGSDQKVPYYKVFDKDSQLTGFIFFTGNLAPNVRGFGGKINLAVYVDTDGKLINYQIVRSNETPSYLQKLSGWHQGLFGRQIFNEKPFDGIKPVTGATYSSKAILSAIELSGRKFADEVLARAQPVIKQKSSSFVLKPDRGAVYLLIAAGLTLVVIYRGGFWKRLIFLVFNVVIGGVILNVQYSTDQLTAFLSELDSVPQLTGAYILMAGIPLLILFFGNIYCGYLCPFGALQELIGYIIPDKWKPPVTDEVIRKARFIKYIVLFVLVMVFSLSRSKSVLYPDPLISVFNLQFSAISLHNAAFVVILFALVGSFFYRRFWCRYLCPAGAFLSLLNNLIIFKRLNTPKGFACCEFGLSTNDKMDCIYCDRCRYRLQSARPDKETKSQVAGLAQFLLVPVLCGAIGLSVIYINKFIEAIPSPTLFASSSLPSELPAATPPSEPSTTAAPAAAPLGQPRDVDERQIQKLIEEKKLSGQEARFYQKTDQ